MRARSIKPGFFKNEDLAALSPLMRLLFAGLWGCADREGRLEDRPKRIKAEVLPYDDCDVDAMLDELSTAPTSDDTPFIVRYEVDEQRYIAIPTFLEHQSPHKNEQMSTIPKESTTKVVLRHNQGSAMAQPWQSSRAHSSSLTPSSLTPSSLTADCGGNGDGQPVDNLVTLALTELPLSESTQADYQRTVDRYRAKMSDEHIERIIYDLAAKPKYHDPKKKLHATLAAWLNREPRDALPPAHKEFKPAAEQTPAEREAAKTAAKAAMERVQAMTGQMVGRPI